MVRITMDDYYSVLSFTEWKMGKTIRDEAFANAGLALFAIMIDPEEVKPAKEFSFTLNGESKEALLYDYLEELITLIDTENLIIHDIEIIIKKIDEGFGLIAKGHGDDAGNYRFNGDVKAMTYSEMLILEEDGKVTVQAVVDI